jgi:tetratricopeptide (TPR) repeat protein
MESLTMRPLCVFGLLLAAACLTANGCARNSTPSIEAVGQEQGAATETKVTVSVPNPNGMPAVDLPVPRAEASAQEKYDAALLEALNLVADRKYAEALVSLGAARALQDTDEIKREIEKIKTLIDQQKVAEQTAQSIQSVLQDGKAEDASRLATVSLQQFGSSDEAERLAKLKREADALTAAQIDDSGSRQARFRQEGENALAEKNLRGAAIAFEQALQCGEDAGLRRQFDEVHAALTRYDDSRQRAAQLRRDPANLEDAIAALQEAAQAWDTLQVRQEIDSYMLALQKRRDRMSVADFEIRGDVGIPAAGRTLAEELLPAFRPRFDVVERGQLARVIEELRLEASDLADNDNGRRELGRLAKVRYLVVGSVTPFCGITVHARLIDVRSGLVVQTAKLVAPRPEALLALMPQLASLLMMSDEQKFAYEQGLAQRAPVVERWVEVAPLPPPPEVVVVGQPAPPPPPPLVVYSARPPDFGGLRPDDFDRVAASDPGLTVSGDVLIKQRLLQVAVHLGDNLFRRGRYKEAHTQFELALNLAPDQVDVRVRVDRCRPLLPPPPPPPPPPMVVVVAPPPTVVVVVPPRPRIVVMNFLVDADPRLAPAGLGDWAADHMASCFAANYEVVDRGEVAWYMGRLGVTMRDLAVNISARRWLGRALNVRYFAFGVVQQTASFNVTAHLVDAETGEKQGLGSIHVQDHQELKLRMNELVQQTRSDPKDQERLQRQARENERLLNEAKRLCKEGKPAQAVEVCRAGLKENPGNVALQAVQQQAEQQTQQMAQEEARRRAFAQQQAQAAAEQKRQQELARQAEAARLRAQQEAASRDQAARRAQEQQRQRAYEQQVAQGQNALRQQHYAQAVQCFESAAALQSTPAVQQQLAEARAQAQAAVQARNAAEKAEREAALRREQAAALARSQAQVEAERRAHQAEEEARRQAAEVRDRALAAQKSAQAKADQDRRMAEEKANKERAAAQAAADMRRQAEERQRLASQPPPQIPTKNPPAPKPAEIASKPPAPSPSAEQEARRKAAEMAAAQKSAQAKLDQERRIAEEKANQERAAQLRRQQEERQRLASQPPPPNNQVKSPADPKRAEMPGPSRAPAPPLADAKSLPAVAPPQPKPSSPAQAGGPAYTKQMQAAAEWDKQQKYDESIAAYQEALRLAPAEVKATVGLHMAQGRKALKAKRFADAAREFEAVLKVMPNHADATQALRQARQGRP